MLKLALLLLIPLSLLSTNICFAWGKTGHELVARIAFDKLSDKAKNEVKRYLGAISVENAGTWMDELRGAKQYDYMKPWHYTNIEKGLSYKPTTEENIVNELIRVIRELGRRETHCDEQIKTDLLVLFHLAGDIHQPLHAGYGEDKGGNSIQVNFIGAGTNLHSLWDSKLIEHLSINRAVVEKAYATLNPKALKTVSDAGVEEWLFQSRSYLPQVYGFTGNSIGGAYATQNREIIVNQLVNAAIRLSATLEKLFGGGPVVAANRDAPAVDFTPTTVKAEDAPKHIGSTLVVCGKVFGIKEGATVNFLNVGADFPNSPLTLVVFPKELKGFKQPLSYYNGKNICIQGALKEYKGKAEIVVTQESQITVK